MFLFLQNNLKRIRIMHLFVQLPPPPPSRPSSSPPPRLPILLMCILYVYYIEPVLSPTELLNTKPISCIHLWREDGAPRGGRQWGGGDMEDAVRHQKKHGPRQGTKTRKVNCGCVFSAYILKPVLSGGYL